MATAKKTPKKVSKAKAKLNKAEKAKADKKKAATSVPVSRKATGVGLSVSRSTGIPAATKADKRKALSALKTKLKGQLIPASQLGNVYMLRRPVGMVEFDIALGGGFPAGGACMISGPFNSGKSWVLWRTIAMQQQIYGDDCSVAVHVAETQMPYDQMRQAGMKIRVPDDVIQQYIRRDLELGLPMWSAEKIADYKVQVGEIHVIPGGVGEDVLDAVLACVESNIFSVIGVDSVSSLMPARDADKDMNEEVARAARALMMQKFWEKYVPHVNKGVNTTSLLFIQQVRANNSSYGKDWTITGGEATKHYKLIDIAIFPGSQIRRQFNGVQHTVGKEIKFETIKGKAGTHDNIRGQYNFYYSEFMAGNVDIYGDLLAYAMQHGLVTNTSKGIQFLNAVTREPIEGLFAPTQTAFKDCMIADFDFELDVRRHIMAAAGLECLYR